jgi:hypothetical protein
MAADPQKVGPMPRGSRLCGRAGLRALVLVLAAAFAFPAVAAPPPVTLRLVASGFSQPLEIVNAGDGSGRLFVLEKTGQVKIIKDGEVLARPFLDLSAEVSTDGERGLLGLAFHPQFASNRKLYANYTRRSDGAIVVGEFLADAADPDRADAASKRVVIQIAHPGASNHNGGRIAFGPDGYLYIATGDGGGSGDPANNAQNLSVLLGKILRIDINTPSSYAMPLSNPFVGRAGADEIWAYGLRNPWKFSFDRGTGALFIGDVGQNLWEEIDFEPAGDQGGRNYGWREMEGSHCYPPSSSCSSVGKVLPVIEYAHSTENGRSVTGGYRYRGKKSRALRGFYIYGDFISNRVWAAEFNGTWVSWVLIPQPNATQLISSFGEDEAGELYIASYGSGAVFAIDAPGPGLRTYADFNGDGRSDILWRNAVSGENYIYPMNGKAILATEGHLRTVADQSWQVAGIGDFDGDAKADILWRNSSTGENYVYLMNGSAIAGEGYLRTVADQDWQVAGVGDFNGDGKDDILWRNASSGENYIYPMDGLAILAGEGYLRTVADLDWQVAGVGDLDGDGKADILWRHAVSGENYLYPMDGRTIRPGEGFLRTVADLNWQVAALGDFNGDGRDDVLWRNRSTGENYLYPMDGRQIMPEEGYLRTVADPAWEVAQAGDFDGDGNADILWRNSATGENYVYSMNGTSIKPTEGFVRSVPDQNWRVVSGD